MNSGKTADLIEMPFVVHGELGGPKEPCIRWVVHIGAT